MGAVHGGIDPITGMTVGKVEPDLEYDDWLMWFFIKFGMERTSDSTVYDGGYPNTAVDIKHMEREAEVTDNDVEIYYRMTEKGKRYLEMLENYDRLTNTSNDRSE